MLLETDDEPAAAPETVETVERTDIGSSMEARLKRGSGTRDEDSVTIKAKGRTRHGQPIEDTESVSLSTIANLCWSMVNAPDAALIVEDDLTFHADATRLQQVLENLFRNAVEHGGSEVTIRVGALDDSSGFYVSDDGTGIPEDERDEVLETGYSTTESGTGLGLAIVQEIAHAHDWTLTLTESDTGGVRIEIANLRRSTANSVGEF
jgi:signal transduction histidine kinase